MRKKRKKQSAGKYRKTKGAGLEYYAVLTLEYNGYHASKKPLSLGVEDVIAAQKKESNVFVQAKNHAYERIDPKTGKKIKLNPFHTALSPMGKEILRFHAEEYGAIPVFLYKASRGKNVWWDLSKNEEITWLKPFTKEWKEKRSRIKKKLADLKNKKKGGSIEKWEIYVLENKEEVKSFIC